MHRHDQIPHLPPGRCAGGRAAARHRGPRRRRPARLRRRQHGPEGEAFGGFLPLRQRHLGRQEPDSARVQPLGFLCRTAGAKPRHPQGNLRARGHQGRRAERQRLAEDWRLLRQRHGRGAHREGRRDSAGRRVCAHRRHQGSGRARDGARPPAVVRRQCGLQLRRRPGRQGQHQNHRANPAGRTRPAGSGLLHQGGRRLEEDCATRTSPT